MYRVGLIGGGEVARGHLEGLGELGNVQVVGVAEIDPERRGWLEQAYRVKTYADYRDMLAKENLDIAIVGLPHYLHLEASLDAFSAGAHVLLEKPMEITVERCDQIIDGARKHGRKLFIGHTQRYIAQNRLAKEVAYSGEIGELIKVHELLAWRYFTQGRPRWFLEKEKAGGGILMNLGVHLIDLASWFLNSRVCRVFARVGYHKEFVTADSEETVLLEFENGKVATLCISGYGGDRQSNDAIGTEGLVNFSMDGEVVVRRNVSDAEKYGRTEERKVPIAERPNAMKLEMQELIRAIETDTEPELSGEYGRYVIAVAMAAYRSSEWGEPVEVEPPR